MITSLATAALLLAAAHPAEAATVGVVVRVEGTEVPPEAVEAMIWHALYERHGHDALLLDALDEGTPARMRAEHLTSLYAFDVRWDPWVHTVDGFGSFAAYAPTVAASEYVLVEGALQPRATWTTQGALALYEVHRESSDAFVHLPQVALQECLGLAVDPVVGRTWAATPDLVTVPIVLASDEEYRAFYGPRWQQVAARRVHRASAMLEQAGLRLDIVGSEEWATPADQHDLSQYLDVLTRQPRTVPSAIRVGFTQQTDLTRTWDDDMEDVGRAWLPGRDVVIADQALVPGHDPAWDEADEAVAVAHEVLHALGLPHLEMAGHLMSAKKSATVHRLSDPSRELARAAAEARFAHWDPVLAMIALGQAAEARLTDPDLQVEYITANLALGPGVPTPDRIEPTRLSALTNVAMGRYYLERAKEDPRNAHALRQHALVHTEVALRQQPTSTEALALRQELGAPAAPPPAVAAEPEPPAPARPCQALAWYGTDRACSE